MAEELSLTVTLLKLISVLNRANQLQPIEAAKGVLVRKKLAQVGHSFITALQAYR